MPDAPALYLYAAFIGDGFLYALETSDNDDPEDAGYWYSLRHQEVTCPVCCGDEGGHLRARDGRPVTCPECHGSGVTEGEPFTVTRYGPVTEEQADAAELADQGDGYDNAAALHKWAVDHGIPSVDVVDWSPEYAPIPETGDEDEDDNEG